MRDVKGGSDPIRGASPRHPGTDPAFARSCARSGHLLAIIDGMRNLECDFQRNTRGCSMFHALSFLPTLRLPLSVQCRAWKWHARAGNELVDHFSLQHTDFWKCLVPCDALRIAQECISPKDAP